jgi:uncharacterized SAM-binding protein YcdF (DUF218 family)
MRRRTLLIWGGLLAVLAAGLGVYLGILAIQIDRQSAVDEARPADVIVILGAAAYWAHPSPVLRARLDHGFDLFERGIAPRILTTGGSGGDPIFTESEVGRAYLMKRGVPSEAIIIEPEGDSTVYSATAAGEIMRRMKLTSCVVVSDGYHIFRVKKLLEAYGLTVYGSPRPTTSVRGREHWKRCFRQAAGHLLWRLGIPV